MVAPFCDIENYLKITTSASLWMFAAKKCFYIYDNFSRGSHENLENVLKDAQVNIYEAGGDITHPDLLSAAFAMS
ncbi:hypothetical protein [Terasakiella sp.]|uniref:hypothetical protein n=1 Tax=Terasakiella sp. TaxID=2034861 RepID=UPI003AA90F29